jgi:hypothetical protein
VEEEDATIFQSKDFKRRDYRIDIGTDGRPTLKYISNILCESVDWMLLTQDKDKLRAVLNVLMKFRVP